MHSQFAITLVSFKRTGYYATDEWVNAVCVKRTVAYASWLLATAETAVRIQVWLTSTFFLI